MPTSIGDRTPLATLSSAMPLLLRANDSPNPWSRILQGLAHSDTFYCGTTIGICRLDLDEGVREILASYGSRVHRRITCSISTTNTRVLSAELLSRTRNGHPLVACDEQGQSRLGEILRGLLPPDLAQPLAVIPLVRGGRIHGAFWVEGYDPAHCCIERLQALQVLGGWLSLSLEVNRHHQEERETNSVLEVALGAQEREKERIALDIHDGPVQLLASAFQYMQAAKDGRRSDDGTRNALAKAGGLVRQAMHELRGLMNSLRPATLDMFGLIASIESDLGELRSAGWDTELVADNLRLSKDRETSLYRIIHEALTNVRNHAGKCKVCVSLTRGKQCLWVDVRDSGRGFHSAPLRRQDERERFGLLSMRKRTELLGGSFQIQSEPAGGTRISLQIPMRRRGD